MMSARPCGNCKKTVYVNEKMDAEGHWYHRPCFKCMAPGCNTSLTLRNFQVAALENAEIDGYTGKPTKVLVCKEHVPMPKHSLTTDSLSIKHTTSAPKPSVSGLHRSVMGDRSKDGSLVGISPSSNNNNKLHSPRSLDQGSHASLLETATHALEKNEDQPSSAGSTGGGNTLPKFRNGRFVVEAADSIAVSHKEQEEAQDVHKDDGSFRNIPVHHRDYEHPDAVESKSEKVISAGVPPRGASERTDEWDDGLEDNKQERIFTMKGATNGAAKHHEEKDEEESDPNKAGLSLSSKLMDQHRRRVGGGVHESEDEKDSAVEDDEWDSAPTDEYSRREGAVIM